MLLWEEASAAKVAKPLRSGGGFYGGLELPIARSDVFDPTVAEEHPVRRDGEATGIGSSVAGSAGVPSFEPPRS